STFVLAADPVRHQNAVIRITGAISAVPVKKTSGFLARYIGVESLKAKIKLRQPRQMCKICSHPHGWSRRTQRRDFVLHKRICIKCQPVAKVGNPISEIKCRAPISRITLASRCHIERSERPQKVVPGERQVRSAEQHCVPKAEFQILGWLESNF